MQMLQSGDSRTCRTLQIQCSGHVTHRNMLCSCEEQWAELVSGNLHSQLVPPFLPRIHSAASLHSAANWRRRRKGGGCGGRGRGCGEFHEWNQSGDVNRDRLTQESRGQAGRRYKSRSAVRGPNSSRTRPRNPGAEPKAPRTPQQRGRSWGGRLKPPNDDSTEVRTTSFLCWKH